MQPPLDHTSSDADVAAGVLAALLAEPEPLPRYEALTRAQGVYEALTKTIAAERARAVADMHTAGLSYGRIAEVIGFTRSRAQQLVERAEPLTPANPPRKPRSMATQAEITAFLEDHVADWPRVNQYFPNHYTGLWPQMRLVSDVHDAESVAVDLFANAEFRALQLGTWLNTPDGQLLAVAVEALTPALYRPDVELLIKALDLAAKMQQDDGRKRAATAAALVAVGGAILMASRG